MAWKRRTKKAPRKRTFKKRSSFKPKTRKTFKKRGTGYTIPFRTRTAKKKFLYKNSNYWAPATASGYFFIANNSCFDADVTNLLGNKQPLFYDQWCSNTGSYTKYCVDAWSTSLRIQNLAANALTVYLIPNRLYTTIMDTEAEVQNLPGVKIYTVGGVNGSNSVVNLTVPFTRTRRAVSPYDSTNNTAVYNASPSIINYTGVFVVSSNATDLIYVRMTLAHVQYVTLSDPAFIAS